MITSLHNCRFLLAGSALLLIPQSYRAQGLEGIIVEQYHTVTQEDADFINSGSGDHVIPVGAVVYRIYVDMAPNYRLLTVFGSPETEPGSGVSPNPLHIETSTTFWNYNTSVDYSPVRTRDLPNRNAFDSYITIHQAGKSGGTLLNCAGYGGGSSANTQQVGVPRSVDPDGNMTLCNAYPGFTGEDGHIANPFPNAVPALTTNLGGLIDFSAVEADGDQLVIINDSWATLPALTGIEPEGTNRVLIGQFTTDGVFSFQINVALSDPDQNVEEYVHTNAAVGQQVSAFLTFSSALPSDCEGVPGGSAIPGTACDDGDPNTSDDVYDENCTCSGTPISTGMAGHPGVPGARVYPNPADERIQVDGLTADVASMHLFDAAGRSVDPDLQLILGGAVIHVNGLSDGSYLLMIIHRSGRIEHHRVAIAH